MNPLHFQQRPLGQQRPATAGKMGQQWGPRQHLTGFQRVPIENPFCYHSVAVGGFLEDGTSLMYTIKVPTEAVMDIPTTTFFTKFYSKRGHTNSTEHGMIHWHPQASSGLNQRIITPPSRKVCIPSTNQSQNQNSQTPAISQKETTE